MEKYKEPQIYIVNNREITERLSQNYIVATGDLGVAKTVEYEEYVNKRYVDLEYSMISNLHEYSVVIIDLQNENDTRHCLEDVGRILRTFKIKKNVEVTDNGKIII